MTTIMQLKFKCPKCAKVFQGTALGSMGHRGTDEQLCREYWGLNPMPYFLTICPHCDYVDWQGDFEQMDDKPDESLLRAEHSCESFERYIRRLVEEHAEPAIIAYISQQSGCCRKINGENPIEQFKRAAEYFQKAKDAGVKEFGGLEISEWIDRMKSMQHS